MSEAVVTTAKKLLEECRVYLPTESGANMYWEYRREKVEALAQRLADALAEIERLRAAFDRELQENVTDEIGDQLMQLRQRAEAAEAELHEWRTKRLHGGCEEDRLAEVARRAEAEARLADALAEVERLRGVVEQHHGEARWEEVSANLCQHAEHAEAEVERLPVLDDLLDEAARTIDWLCQREKWWQELWKRRTDEKLRYSDMDRLYELARLLDLDDAAKEKP